ncbi:MAG: hypothetical protein M3Z54_01300 [Gemmatimonadota bacterium]|nr:hypothetical protein [Gemmatimonadota bacterium]
MKRLALAAIAASTLLACERNPVDPGSTAQIASSQPSSVVEVKLPPACSKLPTGLQLAKLIETVKGLKLDQKLTDALVGSLQKAALALLAGKTDGAIASLKEFESLVTANPKAIPKEVGIPLTIAVDCLIGLLTQVKK